MAAGLLVWVIVGVFFAAVLLDVRARVKVWTLSTTLKVLCLVLALVCAILLLRVVLDRRWMPSGTLQPLAEDAPSRPLFGSAYNDVRVWRTGNSSEYDLHFAKHMRVVTAENACKSAFIMPNASGSFDFSGCDRVRAFARENGMKFRLHTLAWGNFNPAWMASVPDEERPALLERYVRSVMSHYGDVDYVDVVNEAVCDDYPAGAGNCGTGPGHLKVTGASGTCTTRRMPSAARLPLPFRPGSGYPPSRITWSRRSPLPGSFAPSVRWSTTTTVPSPPSISSTATSTNASLSWSQGFAAVAFQLTPWASSSTRATRARPSARESAENTWKGWSTSSRGSRLLASRFT